VTRTDYRLHQVASDLFGETSMQEFSEEYWGKSPLRLERHQPQFYSSIFTTSILEQILLGAPIPAAWVRLVMNEQDIPPRAYSRQGGDGPGGVPLLDADSVIRLYRAGATMVFPRVNEHVPAVASLCRSIEEISGFPVQANSYLTPKGGNGFAAHWDNHDVVVLQIEGAKRWLIFDEPEVGLPRVSDHCDSTRLDLKGPFQEFELRAGDLLYIPRGHVHQAFAIDDRSLHLSLAIKALLVGEVLQELIESNIDRTAALRASLPFGYWSTSEGIEAAAEKVRHASRHAFDGAVGAVLDVHVRSLTQQSQAFLNHDGMLT
jgi:lysine-specific demethylase/histidyl-hydroxylase NO66